MACARRLLLLGLVAGGAAFSSMPHSHGTSGGAVSGAFCICGNYPLYSTSVANSHQMCFFGTQYYMPTGGSMAGGSCTGSGYTDFMQGNHQMSCANMTQGCSNQAHAGHGHGQMG